MPHLIQPIAIDGTLYCTTSGKVTHTVARPWRTISFVEDSMVKDTVEADDTWRMDGGLSDTGGIYGSITFGTSCINSMTIEVNYDKDSVAYGSFSIERNGVEIISIPIERNRSTNDIDPSTGMPYNPPFVETITLIFPADERPCGHVWSLIGSLPASEDGSIFMKIKILDVT